MSKRVFLSYKRHSEPDEPLALEVHGALSDAGHHVFIDQQMPAGIKWAEQISGKIRDCDALVVFLGAFAGEAHERVERMLFDAALGLARGNQVHAARLLGVTRNVVRNRMAKHTIGGLGGARGVPRESLPTRRRPELDD